MEAPQKISDEAIPVNIKIPTSSPSSNDGHGSLISQLQSNPMFTAGFGIVGLTAGLALFRKGFVSLTSLIRRSMLVTLEIPSKDRSYDWFLHWMSAHQKKGKNVAVINARTAAKGPRSVWDLLLSRFTPGAHDLAVETVIVQHPNGSMSTAFSLIPGPGKHILNYRNKLISVSRTRDTKLMNLQTGSPWETVILTTLYRDRHIFTELLQEAQVLALKLSEGKTVIYTSWGTEWRPFGPPRRKRPLDSVILDKGVKERIVTDIKDFLGSAKWYYDRGIPYRRGYLLYGPPGSGKSSFINALAGEFDYNICILNLSERGLTDDRLNHLLTNLPERSIALLEDADAAFGNRRVQHSEDGYKGANVTFSGLLNALDGIASGEERVLFLTTNFRERLDDALVRPGRVDFEARIGYASEYQVSEMWERFYGKESTTHTDTAIPEETWEQRRVLKERFMDSLQNKGIFSDLDRNGISTAHLQGMFVYNKANPAGAVKMVEEF